MIILISDYHQCEGYVDNNGALEVGCMWDTSFWGGVHYSYPTNGFGAFETRGIHRYSEYFDNPNYGMTCSRN